MTHSIFFSNVNCFSWCVFFGYIILLFCFIASNKLLGGLTFFNPELVPLRVNAFVNWRVAVIWITIDVDPGCCRRCDYSDDRVSLIGVAAARSKVASGTDRRTTLFEDHPARQPPTPPRQRVNHLATGPPTHNLAPLNRSLALIMIDEVALLIVSANCSFPTTARDAQIEQKVSISVLDSIRELDYSSINLL